MRPAGLLRLTFTASIVVAATASAQEQLIDTSAQAARVSRAQGRASLAPPGLTRLETLRTFLRARHDEPTLRDLVQTRQHVTGDVVHETYKQTVAGLDVYGTSVKAAFTRGGELRSVIENLVSTARALRPAQIGPDEALRVVLRRYYPAVNPDFPEVSSVGNVVTFDRRAPLTESPTATRVALPLRGGVLDAGYLVVTWDRDNMLRHTAVSGRGEIVGEQLRTSSEAYRIFPNHPGVTPQELVDNPASPLASPIGWVSSNTTTGNNVDAYLDRDNNNAADADGRPTADNQIFDFAWDPLADPTTTANQQAAVTNLFYLTNRLHDLLYGYGFTESAGNFQEDNFGNGGVGGDRLNAEGQDGGGFNNANFATPLDGERPRMQMYLWSTASPNRDGDLDSDIVYHEYTHGLTWRMVGDMSGVTGGAVGEGMSDTLAIYLNGDDRVAEYSNNNPNGIRQYPYTNYPRTYRYVVGILGPHLDGEIFAATMWRLRELWMARGWSQDVLLRYIVDGLNYTVTKPAFEHMRDGLLQSIANLPTAVNPQQARCVVWDAFAQYGIGVNAIGRETCPLGLCLFQAIESFEKPADCPSSPQNTAPTTHITMPGPNTTVVLGTLVNFQGSASDTEDGDLSATITWSSNLQGEIGTGPAFSRSDLIVGTHTISAGVVDSGGLAGSAVVVLTVQPPPNTPPQVTISSPANGVTVVAGTSVTFTGSAQDAQDGNVSGSLVWRSHLQGQIGTGASFSTSALSVGSHSVTATATDSASSTGTAVVVVNVQAAPPPYTLSATARVVKKRRYVDLVWSGATGTSVDVFRNNALVVTTVNDGAHTDQPPARGSSFSYRICNVGSSACSNTVTVTF